MPAKIITQPSVEPVTLAVARQHCREIGTENDAEISMLIPAARRQCEGRLRRALITQGWQYVAGTFPGSYDYQRGRDPHASLCGADLQAANAILLPMPNLLAVSEALYFNSDGVSTPLVEGTDYVLDKLSEPGAILPLGAYRWPATSVGPAAISFKYTCGYGPAPSDVPDDLRLWICELVAHWLEQPEGAQATPGLTTSVPTAFLDELLSPYIVHHGAE